MFVIVLIDILRLFLCIAGYFHCNLYNNVYVIYFGRIMTARGRNNDWEEFNNSYDQDDDAG